MKLTVEIEEAEEGGYVVRCVEIPGAISEGETIDEALENAKDAIREVLKARRDRARKMAKAHKSTFKVINVVHA